MLSLLPTEIQDIIYDYINDIPFTMYFTIDTYGFWSEHKRYKIFFKWGPVNHHTEFINAGETIYVNDNGAKYNIHIYTNEDQIIKFDFINNCILVGDDHTSIYVSDKQMKRMLDICTKTLNDSSFNVVKYPD